MRGNIDLTSLKFRVLDEVDEMLRIGFVDDVEFILGICNYSSMLGTVLCIIPLSGVSLLLWSILFIELSILLVHYISFLIFCV